MALEDFMHYVTKEKDNGDFTRDNLCIIFVSISSLYSIGAVLAVLLPVADMEVLREHE